MKPKVTVAIVCYNEEEKIKRCLLSVLNQSYGSKNYEILVVDNDSRDDTLKIIRTLQKKTHRKKLLRIRLVVNPRRGIAISRNVALSLSKGKLLAFTDADCVVSKNWLKNLVNSFLKYKSKDPSMAAVGGSNITPPTTVFYQAHRIAMDTLIGSRNSIQTRCFAQDRYVNHTPCLNVLFDKAKVKKVGGFDESFGNIAEDEDLTARLLLGGYHLVYAANAGLVHYLRHNLQLWSQNVFAYGKGRTWLLQKHPHKIHVYFLMPAILVITSPVSLPFYLPVIFLYSGWLAYRHRRLPLWWQIFGIFVSTHFFYGLGEIYGLFKPRPRC